MTSVQNTIVNQSLKVYLIANLKDTVFQNIRGRVSVSVTESVKSIINRIFQIVPDTFMGLLLQNTITYSIVICIQDSMKESLKNYNKIQLEEIFKLL